MSHQAWRDEALTDGAGCLLPGEDRRRAVLDDAIHWVAVYEQLSCFLAGLGNGSSLIAASLERYRLGLDYWRERRAELLAALAADGQGTVHEASAP